MATEKAYDTALGRLIRQKRVLVGLTQTKLADSVGVSPQQVQKYEKGTDRVTVGRLMKLCETLDVEPGELVREACDLVGDRSGNRTNVRDIAEGSFELRLLKASRGVPRDVREHVLRLVRAVGKAG